MTTADKQIDSPTFAHKKIDPLQIDKTLQFIYSLHSSLNVQSVIEKFAHGSKSRVNFDYLCYENCPQGIDISIGEPDTNSFKHTLTINSEYLGEIQFRRNQKFATQEIVELEYLLGFLLIPLKNALQHHEAVQSSLHDSLTNVFNRKAFDASLNREIQLAKRHNTPLSILILDIDHFKNVNDSYGHQVGDLILQHFTTILQSIVRDSDIIFRIGGEEFAILLTATDTAGAIILAERLRKAVATSCYKYQNLDITITTSIGIASCTNRDHPQSLMSKADKALYKAKNQGRNRVCK